ncbi:hypothetical protein HPB50_020868 [Hyalomma asiaticum]|uniref:Uncharacterized protein n=1 Tax=Hyalomma asiaticum TaxID=266040 RepID=A0ACB7RR06_HYAAI|nr:hypothetical protein HPB50_020868 [Hyalomma asiaticum]
MSRVLLPGCRGGAGPGFPPRGGDEQDHQPPSLLDQELLECLREQLPCRARRGDEFAPEVVLEFVRSITELQGDDFKERGIPPEHPQASERRALTPA